MGESVTVIQSFTATGEWVCPTGVTEVEYLLLRVGGGGSSFGGGGAGGGFRTASGFSVSAGTTYTVTVGAGGVGAASSIRGTNGGDSSIAGAPISENPAGAGTNTFKAYGGGGGGGSDLPNGSNGGSGGGGNESGTGGTGDTPNTSPAQGTNGGNGGTGSSASARGGGGGGATVAGTNGTVGGTAGTGGAGDTSSISGSSVGYAGGAGGAGGSPSGGIGPGATSLVVVMVETKVHRPKQEPPIQEVGVVEDIAQGKEFQGKTVDLALSS
jgi:hypothetical protein